MYKIITVKEDELKCLKKHGVQIIAVLDHHQWCEKWNGEDAWWELTLLVDTGE